MLKHQQSAFFQHTLVKNHFRDFGQFLQCVWRIGKNKVELHSARLDKLEHIGA